MIRILISGEHGYIANCFAQSLTDQACYETKTISLRGDGWRTVDFSGYDVVVHTAALVHQRETEGNAPLYNKINRDLTIELAEKARVEGVRQFVFLSTSSVYGKVEGVITKDTKPQPVTNYGKSKLEAEKGLSSMSSKDFSVAIVRPLMVYGKDCKGNYQTLVKIAKIAPVLPDYENCRSLVSVETLCAEMKKLIDQQAEVIFFPQEETPICTCRLIQQVAESYGRHPRRTKLLNPVIQLLRMTTSQGKKAFGDLVYQDLEMLPLDSLKKC